MCKKQTSYEITVCASCVVAEITAREGGPFTDWIFEVLFVSCSWRGVSR